MKGNQVKTEYRIHRSVLYLDKNVDNFLKNKYILSLGYDDYIDPQSGKVTDTALVFKIWDFMSLDDYPQATNKGGLTGGCAWNNEINPNGMSVPAMFKLEIEGVPYLEPVKKFAVSKDLWMAALVTSNNQIMICRVSIFYFVLFIFDISIADRYGLNRKVHVHERTQVCELL